VREDQLDIAFMAFPHEIHDLHSRVFWRDRLMAVMPDTHSLAEQETVEWKDLSQETFVVRETGTGPQVHDLIVVRSTGRWPIPTIRRFDVGRDSLLSMVAKGQGITLIASEQAAQAPPGLAFRPVQDEPEAVAFWAVWSPHNRSPALRKLLLLAKHMTRSQNEG
jgi:DNA-binding transcriptional LysR family regulator